MLAALFASFLLGVATIAQLWIWAVYSRLAICWGLSWLAIGSGTLVIAACQRYQSDFRYGHATGHENWFVAAGALCWVVGRYFQDRIVSLPGYDAVIKAGYYTSGIFGAYSLGANNVANVTALYAGELNLLSDTAAELVGGASIALGLSPFTMQFTESVLFICFNRSLRTYGGDLAVGAMTILSSVMQFAMLPLQGLGQGSQPIISYNYGARNTGRVKQAFWLLLKADCCYSTLLWAFVMLFPRLFASLFTNDAALIDFTAPALRTYLAVLLLFGVQMACQMTFVSIGNALMSAIAAIVRKFVLLLPLIYLMPVLFPANKTFAVYLAEPVTDTLAVAFTATAFFFSFRKALAKLERPVE